jgi:hypothetical protein
VPGNAPEDVGNGPSAISHSSGRHEQHRGSDLPQLGRAKHRAEAARPQLETALAPGIYVVASSKRKSILLGWRRTDGSRYHNYVGRPQGSVRFHAACSNLDS